MPTLHGLSIVHAVTQRRYKAENANTIVIIKDGVHIDTMTPEEMIEHAKVMIQVARHTIERRPKEAEKLALDSAILLRAGAPFGLTSNVKILEEAKKEAETNRDLRRYMPGGIKGNTQFGRPGVHHVDTKPAGK